MLALLIDGAATRARVLNADAFPTAAVLNADAILATANEDRRRESPHRPTGPLEDGRWFPD